MTHEDVLNSPVLSIGFRPFFLLGSIWSALALGAWIFAFAGHAALPTPLGALGWHMHEMVFGFVLAAIAGFMLTAVANWTGRQPIRGTLLAGLVLLWALARVLNLLSPAVPLWLIAAVDVSFPALLALLAAREIVAARSWRNLMMPVPIAVLGGGDLLMYLEAAGWPVPTGIGWRLALAAVITLVSVVGARIIPVFTRNWLAARGETSFPVSRVGIDRSASGILHGGLLGWALFPDNRVAGVLLLLGAGLNLARLFGWRGIATWREPLLAILHIGYLWVVIGAALLGVATFTSAIPETAAIHALTAGAIGTMTLAVMTRVCRGHTGRPLRADGPTLLIYSLVVLAAIIRVAAAFFTQVVVALLAISATLWVGAFLLFVGWCAPIVFRPRPDGKL